MKQGQSEPVTLPKAVPGAPQAIELRHLRCFVAVAEAGSFTHAAERMFIAQPTLSQQIRRLEEFVGAQLLHRRREGLQLTKAGAVLLAWSRQTRRREEFVGAQLRRRRREGLQLTKAGAVLLEAGRTVLSLVDHEVN